ncbi:MAG: NAD(P)/FAD-dependent oxidoreductase [Flavisolibacter sp.]
MVDYLIVGQGISGTLLSWFLYREGKTFLVIDENSERASSKIAAGIINPVTGRRYAYAWMIEEIMPFAARVYQEMSEYFQSRFIFPKSIIDFFPSVQMRQAFLDRHSENDSYLHAYPDQNHFNQFFHYDFGCGEIKPAYLVHVSELLKAWRKKLQENNTLLEERFEVNDLVMDVDHVRYKNISAEKIIFCEGSEGTDNPWFRLLPYAPNKGEALIIECEDLDLNHIFKKGLMLAPLPAKGQYWLGSNYQWEFENDQPSGAFYQHAHNVLKGWLKNPFRVLDHKAAVRPATIERRPFVGLHPHLPNIGILNGMGTKGTSFAPFFAHQLVQHLVYQFPLSPEADIHRFSRILHR